MPNEIFNYIRWPYYWLIPSIEKNAEEQENKSLVIFFGNDFYNTTDIDYVKFIERTNQCLKYVRDNCGIYELIYRPHPEEREEMMSLDLSSFKIQRDGQTAEEFVLGNRQKIKYAFSFCSTSSIASLSLGINSLIFYRCFDDLFTGVNKIFVDNYLRGLPDNFYISSFDSPLYENKIEVKVDVAAEAYFQDMLSEHKGEIWFFIQENRFLLIIESLLVMMRSIDPNRKINLVISKHHRWTDEKLKVLREKFDQVIALPRVFYSLRPRMLLRALKTAIRVRLIDVGSDAVLIGLAHHDFLENCFMSYKKGLHVSILPEAIWRLNFKTEFLGFDTKRFVESKAGFFFNHLLEPILGLRRTLFLHSEWGSNIYFIRLKEPLEKLYHKVFLIKNSPVE